MQLEQSEREGRVVRGFEKDTQELQRSRHCESPRDLCSDPEGRDGSRG